jgi:hypothetical protein
MVEVEIDGKKYRFRDEFSVLDIVEIGVPLINLDKFKVIEPLFNDDGTPTGKTTEKIEMSIEKMEPEDNRAMMRWNMHLAAQMSRDRIDWIHTTDPVIAGAFMRVVASKEFQAMAGKLIQLTSPKPIGNQIPDEKKKIPI